MYLNSINIKSLDEKYLKQAEKVSTFSIKGADMVTDSPNRKNEIRYLLLRYFFPKLSSNVFIKSTTIQKQAFNSSMAKLKASDNSSYNNLLRYKVQDAVLGPGEVAFYFLYDRLHLGGDTSKGADLIIGGKKYELKAVDYSQRAGRVAGFFTGGTVDVSSVISDIVALGKLYNVPANGNIASIPKLRAAAPNEVARIEKKYAKIVYDQYFKSHETVFLNSETGEIIDVKQVMPKDIGISRLTQGKIQPSILVEG